MQTSIRVNVSRRRPLTCCSHRVASCSMVIPTRNTTRDIRLFETIGGAAPFETTPVTARHQQVYQMVNLLVKTSFLHLLKSRKFITQLRKKITILLGFLLILLYDQRRDTMEKICRLTATMGVCLVVGVLLLSAGCINEQTSLNLYAAAGLKKPMDVVIANYSSTTGANITPNYGPSGGLYAQIGQGQPCDLYYSADWNLIEKLQNEGKVSDAQKFMKEYVVLVVSKTGKEKGIEKAADLTKANTVVAVADPSAPVGVYSENVLKNLKLWDQLNGMGNIKTRPSTVNQVALMVQSDEVDAGYTYSSTAKLYNLTVAEKYGYDLSEEIVFGVAVIRGGNEAKAKDFMNFVRQNSEEFTKYGWEIYA